MKIDKVLLRKMYLTGRGVQSGNKVFCPKKPRSCKNCHFEEYDLHRMKSKGCELFDSEDGRPSDICIPVRDDSAMSEIHADNIRAWVLRFLTS